MTAKDNTTAGADAFKSLKGQQFLSITTFRKTGVGVPTPVWFAQRGNTLYIGTGPTSGKVKRIRNNPKVTVAPCTRSGQITGASVEAKARIVATPQEIQIAEKTLADKYGFARKAYLGAMQVFNFVRRKDAVQQCYLAVEEA